MCLIAYCKFSEMPAARADAAISAILRAAAWNRDGMSLAVFRRGLWRIVRHARTDKDELAAFLFSAAIENRTIALHLRAATCGSVSVANTHPFHVQTRRGYCYLYHNGALWQSRGRDSDTRELARMLSRARMPESRLEEVLEAFSGQRFMLLKPDDPSPVIVGNWITHTPALALSSAALAVTEETCTLSDTTRTQTALNFDSIAD